MKNDERVCVVCGKDCEGTIYFHGVGENVLRYLSIGESAHLDCYIEKCIDAYFTKKYEMTSEKVNSALEFYGRNILLENNRGSSEESRDAQSLRDLFHGA